MINDPFYVTGGTLPVDADSYVPRSADTELLEGLRQGAFCYVLNTRQMGKSSLMVRTARRLREEGCRVIVLDLTAIGQNLSVEQWYFGLLGRAAEQTDREDDLREAWKARRGLGPMQRFVDALREVLLGGTGEIRKVVLFVDEIDAVRSLPFSADEFFAGIRECYNRRAYDPAFKSLTFCLLGVATPADLIRDSRISPFNIGRRIELRDFTPDEAQPLVGGIFPPGELEPFRSLQANRVLRRILYWTNGHPYITQRLCQAVAARLHSDTSRGENESSDEALVDAACGRLFLSRAARESDDNLSFVSSRLLGSGGDVAALLALYAKVRAGKRVPDNPTNPLCGVLRLSGVVTVDKGRLRLRNRIYGQVFDADWVRDNLSHAEQQRQRQAYWQGIVRAAVVGGAGVLMLSGLAGVAVNRAMVARQFGEKAAQQGKLARGRLSRLYVEAGIRAMKTGDDANALPPLLEALRLDAGDPERTALYRRRFAAALTNLPTLEQAWFMPEPLTWADISPNGDYAAAAGEDGSVRLWSLRTREEMPTVLHHGGGPLGRAVFSRDGTKLVTCGADAQARVWAVPSGRLLCTLSHPHREDKRDSVVDASWSHDGKKIATATFGRFVVWDVSAVSAGHKGADATSSISGIVGIVGIDGLHGDNGARIVMQDTGEGADIEGATLSPNGNRLSLVSNNFRAWLVGVSEKTGLYPVGKLGKDACWNAYHTEWSADGRHFLIAGVFNGRGSAGLFEAATGKTLAFFGQGTATVRYAAFGPGEKEIVTAGDDRVARVWNARTGQPLTPPLLHGGAVGCASFSPNGHRLVTGCDDGAVSVWDARTGKPVCAPVHHAEAVVAARFVGDDRHLLTASRDGTVRLWTLPLEASPPKDAAALAATGMIFLPSRQLLQVGSAVEKGGMLPGLTLRDLTTGAVSASATNVPLFSGFQLDANNHRILLTGRKLDALDSLRSTQVWYASLLHPLSPVLQADGGFLSPDGKLVLLMDQKGGGRLVDAATGALRLPAWQNQLESETTAYSVFFTPDSKGVLQAEDAHTLRLHDTQTGAILTPPLKHDAPVEGCVFSPDGRYLFTFTRKSDLRVWDTVTGRLAAPLLGHNLPIAKKGIVFASGGHYALTLGEPFAYLWDLSGNAPLRPRRLPLYNTRHVVFSPDGQTFVARNQNDWLWRTDAVASVTPLLERSHKIRDAVFSPDSRRVLTIRDDGIARVWDIQTGQPITPLLEPGQNVERAVWSADGRMVATVSRATENTVRVWDAQTGDALLFLSPVAAEVTQIAFSPAGGRLFAATRAGLFSWLVPDTSEKIDRLQARAELLSGQRIDATTRATPVIPTALEAAWKHLRKRK